MATPSQNVDPVLDDEDDDVQYLKTVPSNLPTSPASILAIRSNHGNDGHVKMEPFSSETPRSTPVQDKCTDNKKDHENQDGNDIDLESAEVVDYTGVPEPEDSTLLEQVSENASQHLSDSVEPQVQNSSAITSEGNPFMEAPPGHQQDWLAPAYPSPWGNFYPNYPNPWEQSQRSRAPYPQQWSQGSNIPHRNPNWNNSRSHYVHWNRGYGNGYGREQRNWPGERNDYRQRRRSDGYQSSDRKHDTNYHHRPHGNSDPKRTLSCPPPKPEKGEETQGTSKKMKTDKLSSREILQRIRMCTEPECNAGIFAKRDQAASHLRDHHGKELCFVCFRSYSVKEEQVIKHFREAHSEGDKEKALCPVVGCPNMYGYKGMYIHLSKAHLIPEENRRRRE